MDVEEFYHFLTARIAEDQAQADLWERERAVVAMQADHDPDVYLREPWLRATAEVLAKRRLLALVRVQDLLYGDDDWSMGQSDGLHLALQVAGAVYSTHPDYRPEWAPTPEEGA